jgi:hypothetical protein
MDRVAAQTLRVLGIVAISIVIIVAALIFAIASICGLWSSTSSGDQSAKLMIGLGCPLIFVGGIILIAKLAKGIARTRREARGELAIGGAAAAASIPALPRNLAAEEEPLLHLRIAVGARILLSAAILTYQHVQPGSAASMRPYLLAAILGVVMFEAPNAWILWRIREQLERFAVSLAIAYAAVGVLWTGWNFTIYFRFVHNQHLLPIWLLPIAVDIAIIVTGWRARMAMPRRPDDESTLAVAGVIALVYTFVANGLNMVFYRMRLF